MELLMVYFWPPLPCLTLLYKVFEVRNELTVECLVPPNFVELSRCAVGWLWCHSTCKQQIQRCSLRSAMPVGPLLKGMLSLWLSFSSAVSFITPPHTGKTIHGNVKANPKSRKCPRNLKKNSQVKANTYRGQKQARAGRGSLWTAVEAGLWPNVSLEAIVSLLELRGRRKPSPPYLSLLQLRLSVFVPWCHWEILVKHA